ncbi:Solute carrier family 23 member 2 [Nymphon striatum]|nr:Solute carrier family 23 member 2 [Nymphon striatum]
MTVVTLKHRNQTQIQQQQYLAYQGLTCSSCGVETRNRTKPQQQQHFAWQGLTCNSINIIITQKKKKDETKCCLIDDIDQSLLNNVEDIIELNPPSDSTTEQLDLIYGLEEVPPWYTCFFLALQHCLLMITSVIGLPLILIPKLCMDFHEEAVGLLIANCMFVCGAVTFLQTTFGIRLPIAQGPALAFLAPTLAILDLKQWRCPSKETMQLHNITTEDLWRPRLLEIQGALIVSSLAQVFIGIFGISGFFIKFITPLTIVPTITLIGLSLFKVSAEISSLNWGISELFLFTFLVYGSADTVTARVEARFDRTILSRQWINLYLSEHGRMELSGHWGMPTVSIYSTFGLLSAVIAGIVESIGDYYVCAKLTGAGAPPNYAINRAVAVEGIGCIISGLCGPGMGVTSFSGNVGAIGITKVASRRVLQVTGLMLMTFGIFSKLNSIFMALPQPIIGGVLCIICAMITAVGLSTLEHVNMKSTRNLLILGLSLFLGISIPYWVGEHLNFAIIPSGYNFLTASSVILEYSAYFFHVADVPALDQMIRVLLSTQMFVGGFIGFFLDNTVPGTNEERGVITWRKYVEAGKDPNNTSYHFPLRLKIFENLPFMKYFPLSSSYQYN